MGRLAVAVTMALGGWSGGVNAGGLPDPGLCFGADCTVSSSVAPSASADGAAGEHGAENPSFWLVFAKRKNGEHSRVAP
jgi:hypothetical protein